MAALMRRGVISTERPVTIIATGVRQRPLHRLNPLHGWSHLQGSQPPRLSVLRPFLRFRIQRLFLRFRIQRPFLRLRNVMWAHAVARIRSRLADVRTMLVVSCASLCWFRPHKST